MRAKLLSTLLLAVATLVAVPMTASLAAASIDLRRVDSSIADLPFGGSLDQVVTWVRTRLESEYAPRLKLAVDDNERARLRAQLDREVFELRAQMAVFDGRRTGYEVSPVAGEFMTGSNESMAILHSREGDHYFFFINGRFWKYGRLLRADGPFADRVAAEARMIGKPEAVENTTDRRGETSPVKATWSDDKLRVRIWNRRLLYGYDVMFVEYRPIGDKITELRDGREVDTAGPGVDPDLDSFLLNAGEDEEQELRREAKERKEKAATP
ncbi:MAG: hypothetical protein KC635_27925 [Myxococcales bacterium]|nr:hypothetical protein [Myxococcales bacterium]MCB9733886.1 hypothetical protein [Deltaproteobacteria bacterium]